MEYLGWRVLWESDPDTLERRDMMLAQVSCVTANVNGNKTSPQDFMPYRKVEAVDPETLQRKLAATFGAVVAGFEAAEEAAKLR